MSGWELREQPAGDTATYGDIGRHVVRRLRGEAARWSSGAWRLVRTARARTAAWLAATTAAWWWDAWFWLGGLAAAVLAPAIWCRLGARSYRRCVTSPLWRRRTRRWLRRNWADVMEACGLARRAPAGQGAAAWQVPALSHLRWRHGQLVAVPELLLGQTVEDVQDASDRLRVAAGAHRLRVVPNSAWSACELRWIFGDPLAESFDAVLPGTAAAPEFETAQLGLTEDGEPWRLDLRVSTLVAGSAGSGKASVMWGLMLALAPAVRAGLVEVHGVDLKGGMELAMGRDLFTRYATTPEAAVVLLEEAADAMRQRAQAIAGVVRTHDPTAADPLVVVLIDELAAIVAYLTDRDLLRRAEAALSLLLSQGRAPGFYVFGFVQDPRKETVKLRHLFPQSFGLRLRDREEVAMVLGDGAVAAGALCHKISRATPGVGYVLREDGQVVRVRLGYVPDAMIRELAARFPAPRRVAVEASPSPLTSRSPSRSRSTRVRVSDRSARSESDAA